MEKSSIGDLNLQSRSSEQHSGSSFIELEDGEFRCENPQLCASNVSYTNENDSTDLRDHSDEAFNIFPANERCSIPGNKLEKKLTCDTLPSSELNKVKLDLSVSDFQKKSIQSEDPFECGENCLDGNHSVAGLNVDSDASILLHDTNMPNQCGSSGCAVEQVVVLGVWEGSPQIDKDEEGIEASDDISSDNSFYVELTEDEEFHSSTEGGLHNSACSKTTDCLEDDQRGEEVGKEPRGSEDQLEIGLDEPHCNDVACDEVANRDLGDTVKVMHCEAPLSEINSLTHLADKLFGADKEVTVTTLVRDFPQDCQSTSQNSSVTEVLDVTQANNASGQFTAFSLAESKHLNSRSPLVSVRPASTHASPPSGVFNYSSLNGAQLRDTGFSIAELANGNHRCSSPIELNIIQLDSVTPSSGNSSSVQKPSTTSASAISIIDIAISCDSAVPSYDHDSSKHLNSGTGMSNVANVESHAVILVSMADQVEPEHIVMESNEGVNKSSGKGEQLSNRVNQPVNCSSSSAVEVQATSTSDIVTRNSITDASCSTGSHLLSSTREDEVCMPMNFSVRNVVVTAISDFSTEVSSLCAIDTNRSTIEPVEYSAKTRNSNSTLTSNSVTEVPCDLRLKRKLPISFVEIPVKKEKQDNTYEDQQALNSLRKATVTCASNRLVHENPSMPLTNVSAPSTYHKLSQILSVKTSFAGSSEQNKLMARVTLSRPFGGNLQKPFAAGTSLAFCETPMATAPSLISSSCSSVRPQTVLPPRSFASGVKSRSGAPAVITHTNIRQPFTHVAAPTSTSVARAVTLKVKSHIGRSFSKTYIAPMNAPPDLFLTPPRRFICSGCGDEYVTLAGMQSHLSRRSMFLEFHCMCNNQKWPQIFYNPCSLASFYKAHKRRPGSHSSLDTLTASVLRENTPAYVKLCEEKKRQKEAATAAMNERLLQEQMAKKQRIARSKPNKIAPDAQPEGSNTGVDGGQQFVSQRGRLSSLVEGSTSESMVTEHGSDGCTVQEIVLGSIHKETASELENFFEALNSCKTTCCGCGEVHKSRQALASHYTHRKAIDVSEYVCPKCSMSLSSLCAFIAHQRIHDQKKPYICPECGLMFDNAESFEVFQQHVERACLHFARTPAPFDMCTRCAVQVSDGDAKNMAHHMVDAHTITYHKCQACPMAFGTAAAAERHSSNTGHNARHRVVRKCPTCDAVFESTSSPDIYAHVENHLTSLPFQCSFCTTRFASYSQILDHVRSVHSEEAFQKDMCEVCGDSFSSRQLLYDHIVSTHSKYHKSILSEALSAAMHSNSSRTSDIQKAAVATPGVKSDSAGSSLECVRCQMKFETKELYSRHQAKHRFLENKKEAKKIITRDNLSKDAARRTGEIKHISPQIKNRISCSVCQQKFLSNGELEKHKLSDHSIANYHVCYMCADCFESADALSHHISSRHTGKVLVHAFVCPICKENSDSAPRSFPQQGLLTKHLHTVHRMSRDEATRRSRAATQTDDVVVSSRTSSASSEDATVIKKLYVRGESETYLCAECGFSSPDHSEFTTHVTGTHPPQPADAVQCMECSQSFPVAPALERHLRLVHRIQEGVDRYLTRNGRPPIPVVFEDAVGVSSFHRTDDRISIPLPKCSTPINDAANSNLAATSTSFDNSSPRECNVCYRLFFSFDQLKAHMRVHGMAFIQGTRRKGTDSR